MRSEPALGGVLDVAAFDDMYRTRWLHMVRLAALLLGDATAAEDVAQEAFADTYRHWEKMTSREGASAYLKTAVINGCRSALRHRRVANSAIKRLIAGSHSYALQSPEVDLAERDALLEVLYRLPARQREVMVLRYWLDMSEAETASALSISRGAVKSNGSRALARLRDQIEQLNA